jgi:RNA polymerase sigma factor (TIGR02999 family)
MEMFTEEKSTNADTEIPSISAAAEQTDVGAAATLFPELYSELHRLAERQLVRRGNGTLGATTLLHETYLDLTKRTGTSFPDRARFIGYTARVMRGLTINHARRQRMQKRGGQFAITSLDADVAANTGPSESELELIGAALDELFKLDPLLAELVDLKFFCGFSFAEIASIRQTSERTVQRHWEKARIYLQHSIRPSFSR